MRKLFFLLFFVSINIYTQSSGKVTYVARFDASVIQKDLKSSKFDSLPERKKALKKFIADLEDVEYELNFNKTASIYKKIAQMETDNGKLNITKILAGNKTIYTNIVSKEVLTEQYSFNNLYLVNENYNDIKWVLENESKKIGKYLCYKAVSNYVMKNYKGKAIKKNIIAWYAPALNFRFGPAGYGNLPGLILELKDDKLIYTAVDIVLKNTDINIKKLNSGKKVTKEEFENVGKDFFKKMNN